MLRRLSRRTMLMALACALGGCAAADAESPDTPRSTDETAAGTITQGITGTVTRPDGTVVPGAWIVAESLDIPARPIPEIAILTNETGRFTWPLQPGRYRLTAQVDGQMVAEGEAEVVLGALARLDLVAKN